MNARQTLESRWHSDFDRHPAAKNLFSRLLDVTDRVREHAAAVAANRDLSPEGKQNSIRKFVSDNGAADLRRGRKSLAAMKSAIEARRAKIQPAPVDKTDMAAALLRSEIRQMLRGMTPAARATFLTQAGTDAETIRAVIEAPACVLPIADTVRAHLVERLIEAERPGQLAALDQMREMVTLVESTLQIALDTTKSVAAFENDRVFSQWIEGTTGQRAAAIDSEVNANFATFAQAA